PVRPLPATPPPPPALDRADARRAGRRSPQPERFGTTLPDQLAGTAAGAHLAGPGGTGTADRVAVPHRPPLPRRAAAALLRRDGRRAQRPTGKGGHDRWHPPGPPTGRPTLCPPARRGGSAIAGKQRRRATRGGAERPGPAHRLSGGPGAALPAGRGCGRGPAKKCAEGCHASRAGRIRGGTNRSRPGSSCEAAGGLVRAPPMATVHKHFTCPNGHHWQVPVDGPLAVAVESICCPVCGGTAETLPPAGACTPPDLPAAESGATTGPGAANTPPGTPSGAPIPPALAAHPRYHVLTPL